MISSILIEHSDLNVRCDRTCPRFSKHHCQITVI